MQPAIVKSGQGSPRPMTGLRQAALAALVVALLAALPAAIWLDLQHISRVALTRQAEDINSIITGIRGYYSDNVVARVMSFPGHTQVTHDYESIPGAIPIPATLSLQLGRVIDEKQRSVSYRFISDLPFANRAPHAMDSFERNALSTLRADPKAAPMDITSSGLTTRVRVATPIIMGTACVTCHNSHPQSPKTDWKVGDVRGIQEVTLTQPLAFSLFAFKYTLAYFILVSLAGIAFLLIQRRQAEVIHSMNLELQGKNDFLAAISSKLSHYLSPQIFGSIFSGLKDAAIHAERKKLTIFFSDIKDFTALTEAMQPEEITSILNEYLTEMSAIAIRHGGTIDKFIGDAMLVFFGDPESRGATEDACACMRMALEMQQRLAELNVKWRKLGLEEPFRVRMGINTGFCNVGNFGSRDRMDYTILGSEVNLAARLQSIAEPGHIVASYETYALAMEVAAGHALAPLSVKGIPRQVVPYAIDGRRDAGGSAMSIVTAHAAGLDLYLDPARIAPHALGDVRSALERANAALQAVERSEEEAP